MNGSVPNVKKAKAIHQERQQPRDANVAAMKRGSVGTRLQDTINKAYRGGKSRGR
jgi:hypothetical protein